MPVINVYVRGTGESVTYIEAREKGKARVGNILEKKGALVARRCATNEKRGAPSLEKICEIDDLVRSNLMKSRGKQGQLTQ